MCSKDSVIPVLVIELDGFVHNFKKRKARDEFINSVANVSDLPLLHIKTTEMDKDNIKKKIDFVLSKR